MHYIQPKAISCLCFHHFQYTSSISNLENFSIQKGTMWPTQRGAKQQIIILSLHFLVVSNVCIALLHTLRLSRNFSGANCKDSPFCFKALCKKRVQYLALPDSTPNSHTFNQGTASTTLVSAFRLGATSIHLDAFGVSFQHCTKNSQKLTRESFESKLRLKNRMCNSAGWANTVLQLSKQAWRSRILPLRAWLHEPSTRRTANSGRLSLDVE